MDMFLAQLLPVPLITKRSVTFYEPSFLLTSAQHLNGYLNG